MKPSEAMMKGFEIVGVQCYGKRHEGNKLSPTAVCAAGAYLLGLYGNSSYAGASHIDFTLAYAKHYGFCIEEDNDTNKLTIPQIVERLKAIGY